MFYILYVCSVIKGGVLVRLILLSLQPHVVETMEAIVDVSGHGEVDFMLDVVPF